MSRLYFHTPTDEAALGGAEYEWMRWLAVNAGRGAWEIDHFEGAERLLALVPEERGTGHGENYLHQYLREARVQPEMTQRLLRALGTAVTSGGLNLRVQGTYLTVSDVTLNTAILNGSDAVVMAAKMGGWGSRHAWIDGPDRAWAADIITHALDAGIYRRGMGWESRYAEHDPGDGVLALLRSRDDEPVVLSYSVDEPFPNDEIAGWHNPDPDDHPLGSWYEQPTERQWALAFEGLRNQRPWAQLAPDTLRSVFFSYPVTAYDLTRDDRDEHLRAVLGDGTGSSIAATDPGLRAATPASQQQT